jgi:hypothetical protein
MLVFNIAEHLLFLASANVSHQATIQNSEQVSCLKKKTRV